MRVGGAVMRVCGAVVRVVVAGVVVGVVVSAQFVKLIHKTTNNFVENVPGRAKKSSTTALSSSESYE